MDADFWNQRWQDDRIAFHQGHVNALLETHVDQFELESGARVFVPLCGKAIDMRWLIDQGYRVVGVELSPIAVRDFFDEQDIPWQTRNACSFTVYEGESVTLWCGNFFSLTQEALGKVDAVYDRAALIALPEETRGRYVDTLLQIVGSETPILLLTYQYPESEMEGPPFSVGIEEVCQRFQNRREVAVLESRDVIGQEHGLRQRGLTSLTEHAFLLRSAE